MSERTTPLATFLRENPRWIGVLFWLTVLLTEAGLALGNGGSSGAGP